MLSPLWYCTLALLLQLYCTADLQRSSDNFPQIGTQGIHVEADPKRFLERIALVDNILRVDD